MQLIPKHLYSERIFNDSTTDTPKLRWRNFFSDNVVHGHRHMVTTLTMTRKVTSMMICAESEYDTDSKRTNLETKHIFTNPGPDIMAEPDLLDCLFGYGVPVEEIHVPNTPNKPPGTHILGHRRFR